GCPPRRQRRSAGPCGPERGGHDRADLPRGRGGHQADVCSGARQPLAADPMPEADQPTEPPPQSEEELRARIEEQLRTVRVQDLLLESAVSVLNLTARRIEKEDERDLEQARVGIEGIRAVVDLL